VCLRRVSPSWIVLLGNALVIDPVDSLRSTELPEYPIYKYPTYEYSIYETNRAFNGMG
jgi:hypothetical protein